MDFLAQCLPIDKLHRNEVDSVAFADFMDGGDVRMVERGGGGGLLLEAVHSLSVGSQIGRQDFQCDVTVQAGIFSQINLTHSALAQLRADFVAAEFCAGVDRHRVRVYRYANCQFAVIPRLASGRRKLTVCVTWLRLYAALLRACQNPERLRRDQTRTWFLIRSLPLPVLTQRQKRRQAAALQISLRQNNSLYHVSKARVVAVGASLSNATNGVPSTRQNFSASSGSTRLHWRQRFIF